MSEFRIDQIKNQNATGGPNIAGITTFTGTSGIVMPSGDTRYRYSAIDGEIVKDGLVLWLDAGKQESFGSDGTVWRDLSGQGNNGTLTSGIGFTVEQGGSLIFDGVNDGAKVPRTHLYQTGDEISVEAWINADNISDQDYQAFFTIGGVAGTDRDRSFQMRVSDYTVSGGGEGHIDALYRNSANNAWHILRTSGTPIANNTWYHVVSTYTYGTGSSWKIYINGVEQSTTYQYGDGNADPIQPEDPSIYIGLGEDGRPAFNTGSGEEWLGKIGKVGLYHKTLTAAEVKQNFNALRSRYGL